MITINERNNEMNKFFELENGTQFIHIIGGYEFFAIKINDKYAAFINIRGKFIKAEAFVNCLSIGSGSVTEYNSLEELTNSINNK